MARAEAAHASARSDSIKGLAQSIAKPAYKRLLTAEPALRRAVPALIIAFLITIAVGAFVQVLDHRRTALADASKDIETIAEVLWQRLERPRRASTAPMPGGACNPNSIRRAPRRTTSAGRQISDHQSRWACDRRRARNGGYYRPQASRYPWRRAGARPSWARAPASWTSRSRDGKRALATVRTLEEPLGQIAVFQRRADALASWRSDTALTVTLSATTGFVASDPRLRVPLAGDARARGRPDLRHRPQPHRHRAQSRPLRTVGLGPRARADLLVAFDVRDSRAGAARRTADFRRGQRARSSRRCRSL